MKKRFIKFIFAALFAVCSGASGVFAQTAKQTKPLVMILGSYHMGNPGRDLNNVVADDVLAEKRQKEIADFVRVLKKFKPTKIAVEAMPQNAKLSENYAQYLKGEYALRGDEIDQIAFRLAKEMNLPKVFQIDWKNGFDFDKVLASAKANGQTALTDYFMQSGKAVVGKQSEMMKTATVSEIFRWLNEPSRVDEWHRYYLDMVAVGKADDYAGADLVADWYERNLKIYTNIRRITDSPDDRILILYGAGHHKLLEQYVKDSGKYDLEILNKYL